MGRLHIDDIPEARIRIKGHAVRLGIDVSPLGAIRPAEWLAMCCRANPT